MSGTVKRYLLEEWVRGGGVWSLCDISAFLPHHEASYHERNLKIQVKETQPETLYYEDADTMKLQQGVNISEVLNLQHHRCESLKPRELNLIHLICKISLNYIAKFVKLPLIILLNL
jgi:hypothetical protein